MAKPLFVCLISLFACECRAEYLQLLTAYELGNSKINPSIVNFEIADLPHPGTSLKYLSMPDVLYTRVTEANGFEQTVNTDLAFRLGVGNEIVNETLACSFYTYNNRTAAGARGAVSWIKMVGQPTMFHTLVGGFEIRSILRFNNLLGAPLGSSQLAGLEISLWYIPEPATVGLLITSIVVFCSIRNRLFRC